ncbi:NnrU family protein [Ramlibacter sp. AW1]|uniref:NnrU family protein n=1 Tax=Ramlibacter aurantiacus TaxID=2801330 RepID=A0A936ZH14_9BURK|nr:NnrU family protein [Ramlibacter aurantiacus]MBL0421284.1 NnrU family protein [Ramlibacter aurantiacus]
MTALLLGLILFLGVHSTRIVAEGWRGRFIERRGEGAWKGLYSVIAVIGFVLIVWGYGVARQSPWVLWTPPRGMNHLAALLTVPAFVLLVAAYVPRNHLRLRLRHPMILGVKLWALAHLLANGTVADLLLFGSFLAWAVLDYRSSRQRDRAAQGAAGPAASASTSATMVTVVVGLLLWAGFAFWAHARWIGVAPFGA